MLDDGGLGYRVVPLTGLTGLVCVTRKVLYSVVPRYISVDVSVQMLKEDSNAGTATVELLTVDTGSVCDESLEDELSTAAVELLSLYAGVAAP